MHWDRQTAQQYRQFQKIRRNKRLPKRVAEFHRIGDRLNLVVKRLSNDHLRITNFETTIDVHPLHRNYHNLKTGERGSYTSAWELLLNHFRRGEIQISIH